MNALQDIQPYEFTRCPLHPNYRGGKQGYKITDRASRCSHCKAIWEAKNNILKMPDPLEKELVELDRLLALKFYDVTHHRSDGTFRTVYSNPSLAALDI